MRKIFFVLLLLPFFVKAQKVALYSGLPQQTLIYRGALASDSGLYVMAGCGDPDTSSKINLTLLYLVRKGALIYKDTCSDKVWTSNPDKTWTPLFGQDTNIYVSGDTVIINKIRIRNLLSIPLTDTTHAIKNCGAIIYDTINEHFYGDVCLNGTHAYWGCFDCPETDAIALAKTITLNQGTNVTITGSATQTLGSNPSWTINATSSGGSTNSNIGSGYRLAVPNTNNIKTLHAGTLITMDSVSNANEITINATGDGSQDTVNVANAVSWGADSSGVSDATAAINNMIQNSPKRRFFFPKGRYRISVSALKAASQTNKQGIQLVSNTELFGAGPGNTIFIAIGNTTGDTSNTHWYPVINGFSGNISNVSIHDFKIDGNQDSMNIYNANPYVNPTGHNDTSKHYSVQGIYVKQGDNVNTWNVWADSCQGFGEEAYNVTNFNINNCKFTYNGNGGVGYTSNTATTVGCTGMLSNSLLDNNNSDNVRIINGIGLVTVENCRLSNAKYYIGALNWFAGCYVAARNVVLRGNKVFGNSAYGFDVSYSGGLGDTTTNRGIIIDGNVIYNNANAGIAVSINKAIITNNQIYNNGKTQGGLIDTASASYDPAAISGNNSTDATIQNNVSYDTAATPIQIWFIKKWAGSPTPTFSFKNSIITDNRISQVADTAHAWQGNIGNNSIIYNLITTTAGNIVAPATAAKVLTINTDGTPYWAVVPAGTPTLTATQIAFGDVSNNMTSSANLTYASNAQQILVNNIGATTTNALILSNTQAAAVGAQQYSPRLIFEGRGWKTTATAASQSVQAIIENRPVQSSTSPISQLFMGVNTNVTNTTTATFPSTFSIGSNGVSVFNTSATGATVRINGSMSISAGADVTSGTLSTTMLNIGTSAASGTTLTSFIAMNTSYQNTAATSGIDMTSQLTVTNPSASGVWYGARIKPEINGASYTTAPLEFIGVQGFVKYSQTSSTVFPSLIGVDGGIDITSSTLSRDATLATAFRARVTEAGGVATPTGKLVTFVSYKADSIDNKFYSGTNYGIWQNGTNAINVLDGKLKVGDPTSPAPTAFVDIAAGVTANASLKIGLGVAPTSPNNGDIWNETTNNRLMLRKNGTSEEFLSTSAVNSVSPTAPNRTITVVLNGTTYYIAAKTTND